VRLSKAWLCLLGLHEAVTHVLKQCMCVCFCGRYTQALQRIAALDRCLSVPAGALLLVGPSGSGRRSLLRFVAHAHGLHWWSPRISRCGVVMFCTRVWLGSLARCCSCPRVQ
jgi:hypothetical protein